MAERRGAVVLLTLKRPDRLNAVSLPLYESLIGELCVLARVREVRAIVITGAGRAFCVGADLKAHASDEPDAVVRRRYVGAGQRANRAIQLCPKPVVAAVNGHAIGAGLELALSCDLVVVAREAKLRFPEVALGTFVGGGVTYTLPERVGLLKAKELLLLCEFFLGDEAVALGLANRAEPAARVLEVAIELAEKLAARAPIPMAHAKRLLNRAADPERRRALWREARALLDCMATRDWEEGIRAFHEKREPRFTGE
ncbi:MAG: enoyl-CoA hydratase/isomerase family protein [Gemmatimonadetes bacterium]|nr:enoyl-CoA hydratase/isomerase family protein [Gemmatimonadota bacterium]